MRVEEFLQHELTRRQFLGRSARNAAGMAAGMVGLADAAARAEPQSPLRFGVIGVRAQGLELATALAACPDVELVALCDVDSGALAAAQQQLAARQGTAPRGEPDFRRLLEDPALDAVVIATPDHWHAPMMILACQAGKDVYVESPVSHTIDEGLRMVAAARNSGCIVQCGLQQRSGAHFQSAVDLVRSGGIGRVRLAKAWVVHRRKPIGFKRETDVPEGVDYDLWLGPAAKRPFSPNRFHQNWHWFWDYGTGELGNWGVHLLDVARWGLGVDLPTRIAATGGTFYLHDERETPDTLSVQFAYPAATILWEHRLWSAFGPEGRSAAVAFYGDNGTLIVDRGGWKVYDRRETLVANASDQQLPHLRDFIDSIRTRRAPRADIVTGHLSSALCHLGNIAHRLGREVVFDPASMTFPGDDTANALCARTYRSPWG